MARGVNKAITEEYQTGKSIPQVADVFGLPRSTVRHRLYKAGVLRSRADGVRLAVSQGRGATASLRGCTRTFTDAHKAAIKRARQRWGEENARGYRITSSGYMEYTRGPHKGKSVHRVFAEALLKRKLDIREHVHHRDGNTLNNAPWNLEVLHISAHMSRHAIERDPLRLRDEKGRYTHG